jgi:8-oxo-dGTP diphosphatase
MLPANTRILRALTLPPFYGITMAGDWNEETFLVRARIALDHGLRLIQLREKEWSIARQQAFAASLTGLAARYGAQVLLNGDAEHARAWNLCGRALDVECVDSGERETRRLVVRGVVSHLKRPRQGRCAGTRFCGAGPGVAHTDTSHNTGAGLGPVRSTRRRAMLPVYALGGLTPDDLDTATTYGAHGVAMRRAAWNVD